MGKHRNATKGGSGAQKDISPTLSSCVGEAGGTGDVVHDLRDEMESLEGALSQMGTFSKMPFCFVQCVRSPSGRLISPEHQPSNPANEDQTCYCVQVRVTLGGGGGDQPPPPHATGSMMALKKELPKLWF